MFHRLRVECVELLLSSSVDPVEEKPGQKYIIALLWLICLNQWWSGNRQYKGEYKQT